jgi:hypothetical protein
VWATLKKKHSSGKGWQIAKLDEKSGTWLPDKTQPKGSQYYGSLAVDPTG